MRKNLFVASVRYMRFPGPFRHAFKHFGNSRDEQIRMLVHVTRMAAAPGRYDEEWGLKRAAESYDRRPPDPHARQRQLFARRFDLPPGGISGIKAPTLLEFKRGSWECEIDPLIAPAPGERVLEKRAPSAFFGNDLAESLREQGIDTVVVCGTSLSGCVRASVVDGTLALAISTSAVKAAASLTASSASMRRSTSTSAAFSPWMNRL